MDVAINNIMSLVIGVNLILAGIISLACLIFSIAKKKYSKLSKVVLLVVGVAMLTFGTNLTIEFFGKKQTASIEVQLLEAANNKNKSLPMMIDDQTRFDNMSAKDRNWYYKYTLINYSADQVDKIKLQKTLKESFKKIQCSNANLVAYLEQGISSYYNYYGNDGIPITTVVIPSDFCGTK